MTHQHSNGFEHLDLPLEGLEHEYDLGWKVNPDAYGPPGRKGEPYLLLYVSFAASTGERRPSPDTLSYALARKRWREAVAAGDEDREHLRRLVFERVPEDLLAVERGTHLAWLEEESPLFLPV